MDSIEILPNLWIGNNNVANNNVFFSDKNIRYVVNISNNIPNYFQNVNYLNIHYINKNAFENVLTFIKLAYKKNVGILIHDKINKLSMMFAVYFMIKHLNLSFHDIIKYLIINKYNYIEFIMNNVFLNKLEYKV